MRISGITYVQRESHKARNIFVVFVVLLILIAISVSVVSVIAGWKLTHPKKSDIPSFTSNVAPDYKNVTFYDINKKVSLKGWLFEIKGSEKTIILAHGYSKNRLQFEDKTIDMIKNFLDKNYNVLAFDFRNAGKSGGNITSIGYFEKDDLLGAIKYVKSQGSKHVVLMGFSSGASTCLLAAAESSDVDAVIADSPFSDLKEYLNSNLSVWSGLPSFPFNRTISLSVEMLTGIDTAKVSPKNVIGKLSPRPVLFIHSKDDKKISISNSIELYDAYSKIAGDNAVFWRTEGVDHIGSYKEYPQEYMDKVFAFLQKVYKN